MVLLIAAGICYIPLLCYIQGNLKVAYFYYVGDDRSIFHLIGILLS